jgi:hypothetical protein
MDIEPLPQGTPGADAVDDPGGIEDLPSLAPRTTTSGADSGPCLYLGPAGQRCDRRAVEGGFCAVHRPGGIASRVGNPGRILAAVAAIVTLLWPYLDELVHEIIRWRHSH